MRRTWRAIATIAGMTALAGAVGCGPDTEAECHEAPGVACTWAGTGDLGLEEDVVRHRLDTKFYWVADLEFAPDGRPYILDWNNHLIRRVNADDTIETVVGYFVGDGPGDMSDLTAPGAPGLTVALNHPTDLQFDADGNLIFAAWHNHKLRSFDPDSGMVLVLGGRGAGFAGDGGPLSSALFNQPKNLVMMADGSMLLLDQRNHRIRRIGPPPERVVETIAGTGTAGFSGDGGPPLMAELRFEAGGNPEPSGGLAVGPDGAIYVADGLNHRIRKIDLAANVITTIAGNGERGFSGDGGPATAAQIAHARDIEFGPDGNLYFCDTENNRVRMIEMATGTITTVAGTGEAAMGQHGRLATEVALNRPMGIAFDAEGSLYIADTFNSRILKVTR